MTWEDTDGMVHIVILEDPATGAVSITEFTGDKAREASHEAALKAASLSNSATLQITVCVRVRVLYGTRARVATITR